MARFGWLKLFWLAGLILFTTACQVNNPLAAPSVTAPPATATASPTPIPVPDPNTAAGFDHFLFQLENSQDNRQILADRFVAQLASAPITSNTRVIFLWRGEASMVQLVGDMNSWNLDDAPMLARLQGTDLWYLEAEFERDARLDYQFVIDGDDWQLDPLNPRTLMGDLGPNSEVVMPGYDTPPELLPPEEEIPTGTITSHTLDSAYLNQTRTFFVYKPAGQVVGSQLPSVFINDGGDYLNLIDASTILDRLIARRQIPPLVAVFIPPISRNLEYKFNDAYVSFLADELVPFVQENFDTDPNPARTGTLGASTGGLTAVYSAVSRPDVFGLAAGQSAAFSVDDDPLFGQRIARAVQRVRLFLVTGTYETSVGDDAGTANLLAANRQMAATLQALGYDYEYEERSEGHSWGLWQGTLGEALHFLFVSDER